MSEHQQNILVTKKTKLAARKTISEKKKKPVKADATAPYFKIHFPAFSDLFAHLIIIFV